MKDKNRKDDINFTYARKFLLYNIIIYIHFEHIDNSFHEVDRFSC